VRVVWGVPVVVAVVVLSGCASTAGTLSFSDEIPSGRTPYAGSLVATPTDAERAQPEEWPGAAGDVVQCSSPPRGQTVLGVNTGGAVGADPEAAIRVKMGEGLFLDAPTADLVLERDDGDRVLFTASYGGIARQALIVRDGPSSAGSGAENGHGWYVESFAACDLADFPEAVSAALGVQVWSDRDGARVPTSKVVSSTGPEHCSWQSMTILTLGDRTKEARMYFAHPVAELRKYFDRPYQQHVPVPDDATDTGYELAGRHLWLSVDQDDAYVGTRTDADRWPRPINGLGCA
jgi:hypothetical protein